MQRNIFYPVRTGASRSANGNIIPLSARSLFTADRSRRRSNGVYVFASISLFLILGVGLHISAKSVFDIKFPIAELENCADRAGCRAYCDDSLHKDVCLSFAKEYGIADEKTTERSQTLPEIGPGGCKGEDTCRAYCDDAAHLEECIKFGEDHGLLDKKDAEVARRFSSARGPGDCRGAEQCRSYCDNASNQAECVAFAKKKGLISDKEADTALHVLKNGGPGGCRSSEECKAYCQDAAHLNECTSFGEEHGFISHDEAIKIKKFAMHAGPGGCKNEGECRAFCEDSSHQGECVSWAEENGFMSHEEVAHARKFAGKPGPGGCKGEECKTFCENPDHTKECLQFAEENGLISKEELERAKKFLDASSQGGPSGCRGSQCRDYCSDPAHQEECFKFAKDKGLIDKEDQEKFEAGKKINQKLQESGGPGGCKNENECRTYCSDAAHSEECMAFAAAHGGVSQEKAREMLKEFIEERFQGHGEFHQKDDMERFQQGSEKRFEEFQQLETHFRGRRFPGESQENSRQGAQGFQARNFSGPGGCTSPSECIKYCVAHKDECFSFGSPGRSDARSPEGGTPPGHDEFHIRQDIIHFEGHGGEAPWDNARTEQFVRCISEGIHTGLDERAAREKCEEKFGHPAADFGQPHKSDGSEKGSRICPAMPTVDQCPAGQKKVSVYSSPECGTYYRCMPDSREGFPPGSFPPPAPSLDRAGECTSRGGTWDGTICKFPSVTPPPLSEDPVLRCRAQGGTWDGTTCKFSSSPLPPPPPPSSDRAGECASHGGSWDGTTCRFPSSLPLNQPAPTPGYNWKMENFFATLFKIIHGR